MHVTLAIPDDLAQRIGEAGPDVARRALEALAVEEYRAGRLTQPELRRLLGFGTRAALDGFLKTRAIYLPYDADDLEQDRRDLARLGL